jgi:outer membrane protein OmpA-like peptidoglycan-associated protein
LFPSCSFLKKGLTDIMMNLKTFLSILFFICPVCDADTYSVPLLEADWSLIRGASSCQLKQEIPSYGSVDFLHHSGELLRFSVKENRFKPEIVKASLSLDPPPWMHEPVTVKNYAVSLTLDRQNYPSLDVYGETAETMLDALAKGLYPTFTYLRASKSDLSAETKVVVSSINFSKNYQQFNACRKEFLPYGIKDEIEKSLFFKLRSEALNPLMEQQLNDTARYIKAVEGTSILISSETAIAGNRDKAWFLKRANVIAKKLTEFGVPENKVDIKSGIFSKISNKKIVHLNIFGADALTVIYYRKSNTALTSNERQRLTLLARYAKEFLPSSRLVIRSHTDSKGSRSGNFDISHKRGDVIKRHLISKGMNEKNVQVLAFGESKPAKSNRFPAGRAQNRRVIMDFTN